MKAVIYSRVSNNDQNTSRQINDLMKVSGFEVAKTFSENVSGFSKKMEDRKGLQEALRYMDDEKVEVIMVHEVSRLGRNTLEVLNLIKKLEDKDIKIYIHNLGMTLCRDDIYSKLIVTIMADLARMESETMSQRIKSGIRARKTKGLATGRLTGSLENKERFLSKHKDIIKYLHLGRSYSEITSICKCGMSTVSKVKKSLLE